MRRMRTALCLTAVLVVGMLAAAALGSRQGGDASSGVTTTSQIVSSDPYAKACKALPFVFSQGIGTDALVTIQFAHPPSPASRRGVVAIFDGWYKVGNYGGFGIFFSYVDGPKMVNQGRALQWFADTGGSGRAAFLPLAHALQGYACVRKGTDLRRLIVRGD